ncbi:MAG: hypothetical protein IT228_02730 [Flavobacteriales bacterium]|nr:hypothetical protein [Flavobacteriales bacterium]MCC6576234.1 hypothetical protein [Flavobacteriales bacterium]NUQ15000.1 hypothetical protein [Flavobacteriales bacterium]
MATAPKKFTAGWLVGSVVLGGVIGAALYSMFSPPPPPAPPPACPETPKVTFSSCFSAATVDSIVPKKGTVGIRFYTSKSDGGTIVVLAGAIDSAGKHTVDAHDKLRFREFKGIRGDGTDMNELEESAAETAVKGSRTSERGPWSIDVDTGTVRTLLGVKDANGIGILERRTTAGGWTFVLAPVRLAADTAALVGAEGDVRVGSDPCPLFCPKPPSAYLHMR